MNLFKEFDHAISIDCIKDLIRKGGENPNGYELSIGLYLKTTNLNNSQIAETFIKSIKLGQ